MGIFLSNWLESSLNTYICLLIINFWVRIELLMIKLLLCLIEYRQMGDATFLIDRFILSWFVVPNILLHQLVQLDLILFYCVWELAFWMILGQVILRLIIFILYCIVNLWGLFKTHFVKAVFKFNTSILMSLLYFLVLW